MPFYYNENFDDGFPVERQRMSNWCWAACTTAIGNYYEGSRTFTQQRIVSSILRQPICASPRPVPLCNQMLDLGDALGFAGYLNGDPVENPLSSQDLTSALRTGKPLGCQLDIPNIGGHAVVVISGRKDSTGSLFVRVADPSDGSILTMSFASLRNNFRGTGGRWVRSYFTKPFDQA